MRDCVGSWRLTERVRGRLRGGGWVHTLIGYMDGETAVGGGAGGRG